MTPYPSSSPQDWSLLVKHSPLQFCTVCGVPETVTSCCSYDEERTLTPVQQKLEYQPSEFCFRELSNLKAADTDQQTTYDAKRSSLLVVSNKFGYIFIGTPSGVKVFSSAEVLDTKKTNEKKICPPIVSISLRYPPNWLGLSSDNLTCSVCCRSDKGPQILFFDVRNILNKAKPTKTPFQSLFLSRAPASYVTSLKWNPSQEFSNQLAICLSAGSFHLLSVKKSVEEVGFRHDDFGASTVSWSPEGKQVIVGKNDGSLHLLTQKLEVERVLTVDNIIDRSVKTCDLLWLSTHYACAAYVTFDDTSFSQPNLFLADFPPKDEERDVIWKNYEDPCFGMNESRESQYFFAAIDQWQMFVCLSSNSTDISVIGKDQDSQVWEIWTLDDSSRAALPISEFTEDDSVPIGADIVMTSKSRIVIGDAKDCGAMPVLAVLTNDCVLCLYHMINLMDAYSNIVRPEESLDISGERTSVGKNVLSVGCGDFGKTPLSSLRQKLSAKPSIQLSSSPKSVFLSDEKTKLVQVPASPLKPTFMTSTPADSKLSPFSCGPLMVQQPVHSKLQTKLSSTSSLEPDIPAKHVTKFKAAGIPKEKGTGKLQVTQANYLDTNHTPCEKSVNPKHRISTSVASKGVCSTEVTQHTETKTGKALLSYGPDWQGSLARISKDVNGDLRAVMEDIENFRSELHACCTPAFKAKQALKLFESDTEKKDLIKKPDKLKLFSDEIFQTTRDLSFEINDASRTLLALISNAEGFCQKHSQIETGWYKALLFSRPLEQSMQERMEVIRSLYQYALDSVKDTNLALDSEWEHSLGSSKAGSKRRKQNLLGGDWENAYLGLVNNMKILHQQEEKVMLLSQQFDRLRLEKTNLKKPLTIPLDSYSEDSGHLQLLAESLLPQPRQENLKPPLASGQLAASLAMNQRLSPKKQVQLGQMLAKRKVAPVRVSQKFSTNIATKGTNSYQQEHWTVSSIVEKESSTPESLSETSSVCSSSLEESSQDGDDYCSLHLRVPAEGIARKQTLPPTILNSQSGDSGSADQTLLQKFSMIPQGSATLAYGAPKSATAETARREIPLLSPTSVEATSNLNNPPLVVDIQKFDIRETDETPLPEKFEPKPEVPIGAAKVVQNVLNLVKAEKRFQQTKRFGHEQGESSSSSISPPASLESEQTTTIMCPSNITEVHGRSLFTRPIWPVLPSPSIATSLPPQTSVFSPQISGFIASNNEAESSSRGVSKSASMPLVTGAPVSTTTTLVSSATTQLKLSAFSSPYGVASASLPELFKLSASTTSAFPRTTEHVVLAKSSYGTPGISSTLSSTAYIKKTATNTSVPSLKLQDKDLNGDLEETSKTKSSAPGLLSVESEAVKSFEVSCSFSKLPGEQVDSVGTTSTFSEATIVPVRESESASQASTTSPSLEGKVTTSSSSVFVSDISSVVVSSSVDASVPSVGLFQIPDALATCAEQTKFLTTDTNSSTIAASAATKTASVFSSLVISAEEKTTTAIFPVKASDVTQTPSVFGEISSHEPVSFISSAPISSLSPGDAMCDSKFEVDQTFGKAPTNKPLLGSPNHFVPNTSGNAQLFGSVPSQQEVDNPSFGRFSTSVKETPAFSFGGFGISGLGDKPSNEAAKINPFQAFGSSRDEQDSSSIFGAAGAKSFGHSTSGFGQGFRASIFGNSAGGVGSQGFGGFNKSHHQSVFGAAPTFGSPPSFGSTANRPFSSGFGGQSTAIFGQPSNCESGGFASFAKNDAPGFGNIANSGGFGTSQQPAFGSNNISAENRKAPSFSGWR